MTINLSSHTLTDADIRLLDRGLLFVPTIKTFPIEEILTSRDRLTRSLKLKGYFKDVENDDFDMEAPKCYFA